MTEDHNKIADNVINSIAEYLRHELPVAITKSLSHWDIKFKWSNKYVSDEIIQNKIRETIESTLK